MGLEIILIYVSLILVAVPTDRMNFDNNRNTVPFKSPWGGGGVGVLPIYGLTRHFHISQNVPDLHPKILHRHCFQFLCKIRGANKVHFGKCGISV